MSPASFMPSGSPGVWCWITYNRLSTGAQQNEPEHDAPARVWAGREGFEPSEDLYRPQPLSRRPHSTTLAPSQGSLLAEREGFEPPDLSVNCFQDSRLKPLGHLSACGPSFRIRPRTSPRCASPGSRVRLTSTADLGRSNLAQMRPRLYPSGYPRSTRLLKGRAGHGGAGRR